MFALLSKHNVYVWMETREDFQLIISCSKTWALEIQFNNFLQLILKSTELEYRKTQQEIFIVVNIIISDPPVVMNTMSVATAIITHISFVRKRISQTFDLSTKILFLYSTPIFSKVN